MTTIYTIIVFVLGFGLMVLVHEFGHYITGRIFKADIEEFAIGMGPQIFKKQGKRTLFSIRCVPIGGFVKFKGEDETDKEKIEEVKDNPHYLNNLAVWKRFIIYASGALMNVVLGFVLLLVLALFIGLPYAHYEEDAPPVIEQVASSSAAEEAGIQAGDIILAVNGEAIPQNSFTEALDKVSGFIDGETPLVFKLQRGEETVDVTVTPRYSEQDEKYMIGITYGGHVYYTYEKLSVGEAFTFTFETGGEMMTLIVTTLRDMIFHGEGLDQVSGPVGIISAVRDAVKEGFYMIISIFAALTFNLAVVNLLPFPALDGGKCVLLIIEGIRRKPLPPEKEGWLNVVGFLLLMGLMVVLTIKDIIALF